MPINFSITSLILYLSFLNEQKTICSYKEKITTSVTPSPWIVDLLAKRSASTDQVYEVAKTSGQGSVGRDR